MSINKYVMANIVPEMEEYNYKLIENFAGKQWKFQKKEQESIYEIRFKSSSRGKFLAFYAYVIKGEEWIRCAITKIPGGECFQMPHYKDLKDAKRILNEFMTFVKNDLSNYLELLDTPRIEPSYEMSKKLFKNHELLSKKFKEKFNFQIEQANNNDIKIASKIDELIKNNNIKYEENERFFLEVAAYCGEMIQKNSDVKWFFEEIKGKCKLEGEALRIYPLDEIINFWNVSIYERSFFSTMVSIIQPY